MKCLSASIALLLLGIISLGAVPTDVTYREGDAKIRYKAGKQEDAEIGIVVNTGDTLRTGRDGLVELDQKGVTLKINPNTVFTLMEKEQGGQSSSVLSVALGSMKLRYDKITGREPMVRTNGAQAGVRGTEFSVFAGADGSTLFIVDKGSVEVEAAGKAVTLSDEEGVEVGLGQAPGEKFAVHRDQIDYSRWNDDKLASLLSDPLSAMAGVAESLTAYIKSVEEYDALYREYSERLAGEQAKAVAIAKEKGKEEAAKFNEEVLFPLTMETGNLILNLRYYALAALSLRRYVAGRMYVLLKSRFITRLDDSVYVEFTARFNEFLSRFERSIVPQLVAADI